MIVVDSCGWIEVFAGGPLAESFMPYLRDLRSVVTPTIVIYEVYKKLKQTTSENDALSALTVSDSSFEDLPRVVYFSK